MAFSDVNSDCFSCQPNDVARIEGPWLAGDASGKITMRCSNYGITVTQITTPPGGNPEIAIIEEETGNLMLATITNTDPVNPTGVLRMDVCSFHMLIS